MDTTTINPSTRRTLQAAIDHYPQLAVLRFALMSDTSAQRSEPEEAVGHFLQALQQNIDVLTVQRQGQRKSLQPTLLYALWSLDVDGNIPMLLMLNHNAFGDADEITRVITTTTEQRINLSSTRASPLMSVDRSNTTVFSAQLTALRNCAMQLPSPIYAIRSTRNNDS